MVKVSAEDRLGCKCQPLTLKVFVVFLSAFFENSLAKERLPHSVSCEKLHLESDSGNIFCFFTFVRMFTCPRRA